MSPTLNVLRQSATLAKRSLASSSLASPTRAAPFLRRNFLTIIEQGHEGWRLRCGVSSKVGVIWYCILIYIYLSLGRNPVRLTPGVNIKIPLYHQVTKLDLRESSISIPNVRHHHVRFDYISYIQKPNDSFQDTLPTMFLSYVLDLFSTVCSMGTRWIPILSERVKYTDAFTGMFWSLRCRRKRQKHGNVCREVGSWDLYLRSSIFTFLSSSFFQRITSILPIGHWRQKRAKQTA